MNQRIGELDGLRGIAILLVMLFHFFTSVFAVGWIGVDLFFVLSGFLITGILLDSAGKPNYYLNFIARRALRIFPLYYVVIGVLLGVIYFGFKHEWRQFLQWGSPLNYVFYVANIWQTKMNADPPVFAFLPLWSLQVEEQFYLTYPAIVAFLSPKQLRGFLVGSILIAPILRGIFLFSYPAHRIGAYVLMPCRVDALAWGGLLALMLRTRGLWTIKTSWTLSVSLTAACAVLFLLRPATALDPVVGVVGMSLIGAMFAAWVSSTVAAEGQPSTGVLRFSPLMFLGRISYGVYLFHAPVHFIVKTAAARLNLQDGNVVKIASLAIVVPAAWISWRFFESQILKLKNRFYSEESSRPSRKNIAGERRAATMQQSLEWQRTR
jgi:peptidoglycan/LPS O-acetylase OafA/YrhL